MLLGFIRINVLILVIVIVFYIVSVSDAVTIVIKRFEVVFLMQH